MSAPSRKVTADIRAQIAATRIEAERTIAVAKELAGRGMERAWAIQEQDGGIFCAIHQHLTAAQASLRAMDEASARLAVAKSLKRPELKTYTSSHASLETFRMQVSPAPQTPVLAIKSNSQPDLLSPP